MAMINIGGDDADASYRYKMPKLQTKVEGRGNGIKTVIVNMTEVSKALHIDPAYTTRFFGYELGAQSKYTAKIERAVVNGKHEANALQKHLEKFVEQFILCPNCKLPEIKMIVKKDIKIDCAACGHNGALATVNKLAGYIIKDHKEKREKKKEKGKDGKKKDKKKDRKKDKDKDKAEEAAEEEEDGEEAQEEVVVEEKKPTKKEKEEVVWHTDTSKQAQEERKVNEFKELNKNGSTKKSLDDIINAAGEGLSDSPGVVLKIFLASGDRSVTEVTSEIRRLQLARGLDDAQKVKVLLEALIDMKDLKKVPDLYREHAALLKPFAKEKKGQILIGCIEEQVGIIEPRLLPKVPLIFQALYEEDVLTEEVLLQWHASPPESSWLSNKDVATKVRARAVPFINWLEEAEEESDEE